MTTSVENTPISAVRIVNPHAPNGRTIVMVHGAWHSSAHYLATLDDRPGWAYDFAAAGFRVVLADYPGTGASPEVADPTAITNAFICEGLGHVIDGLGGPVDLLVHSMSGPYGQDLLRTHGKKIDHLVAVAPGQPPELSERPTVFEDLGDSVKIDYGNGEWILPKRGWTEGSLDFVAACIGPGTRFPKIHPTDYQATLSPLWAGLSIEHARDVIDPPAPTVDLTGSSVLVVSAPFDPMISPDACTTYVGWLHDHGARAEQLDLAAHGVEGNAHMMMLEENSAEIATMIVEWLTAA